MNWTNLLNGLSQLLLLSIIIVLLFYVIYRINLGLFRRIKPDFIFNEAVSIYLFGVFGAMALVLNTAFLTLNSYMGMLGLDKKIIIFEADFYWIMIKLLLLSMGVYLLLFSLGLFVFSRLIIGLPVFADMLANNRRSAFLLAGFLLAIFYALGHHIDLIFSSILSTSANVPIF